MATLEETLVGFSRVITRSDVILLCVIQGNCRAIRLYFCTERFRSFSILSFMRSRLNTYFMAVIGRCNGYFGVRSHMHSVTLIKFCKRQSMSVSQTPVFCQSRQHFVDIISAVIAKQSW